MERFHRSLGWRLEQRALILSFSPSQFNLILEVFGFALKFTFAYWVLYCFSDLLAADLIQIISSLRASEINIRSEVLWFPGNCESRSTQRLKRRSVRFQSPSFDRKIRSRPDRAWQYTNEVQTPVDQSRLSLGKRISTQPLSGNGSTIASSFLWYRCWSLGGSIRGTLLATLGICHASANP